MKEEIIEGYRINKLGQVFTYNQWKFELFSNKSYMNIFDEETFREEFNKLKEVEIKIKIENND